jgi:hypothetical protein
MFTALSAIWRAHRQSRDVECTVHDAPAGPRFAIGWTLDDATTFDSPSDARAAMARGRRVRDELIASGHGDLL